MDGLGAVGDFRFKDCLIDQKFERKGAVAVAEKEVEFVQGEVGRLEAVGKVVLGDAGGCLSGTQVGSVCDGWHGCAVFEFDVRVAAEFEDAAFGFIELKAVLGSDGFDGGQEFVEGAGVGGEACGVICV